MKFHKKEVEQYLFLLQRSQLSVFRKSNGKIGTWKFDPKVVNKLEILDLEVFTKTLNTFLSQMKLISGEVTILLDSSIYFTQEVQPISKEQQRELSEYKGEKTELGEAAPEKPISSFEQNEAEIEEKRRFVQSVPFSNTYSNIIEFGKKKLILVTNRDLYEPMIKVLADNHFRVTHIFPMAVVGEVFDHGGYTPEAALMLLHSIDKFKSGDLLNSRMISEDQVSSPAINNQIPTALPEDKKRLYLMLGAFVILLLILGAVVFWSMKRDQKIVITPQTEIVADLPINPEPIESAAVIPLETRIDLGTYLQSTPSANKNLQDLKVSIDYSQEKDEEAQIVQEALKTAGFKEVQVRNLESTTFGPIVIKVSKNVPIILQELLVDELMKLNYQAKVQQIDDFDVDISIVLTSV